MIGELPGPVAVVAHDAGAANILFAWLAASGRRDLQVAVAGPAEKLWRAQFPAHPLLSAVTDALDRAATLLSGTGWASNLEHDARVMAAQRGIRSVAVIDHWVNYAPRFKRDGIRQLPDTILVGDDYAAAIARDTFPDTRVEQLTNLYLRDQAQAAGPVPPAGDILFVAEPARNDWGRGTPGEFQALDHFMAQRASLGIGAEVPMRLRPHPSDEPGKYDAWIDGHSGTSIDPSPDMGAALAGARWVAGLNSFALVIALEAGRAAISCLPPWAPDCVLPHDDIRRI